MQIVTYTMTKQTQRIKRMTNDLHVNVLSSLKTQNEAQS